MSEKKDFMGELAKEIEDKKNGRTASISGIQDYTSKKSRPASADTDDEIRIRPAAKSPVPAAEKAVDEEVPEPDAAEKEPPVFATEENGTEQPDSFAKEERIKVDKPHRELKPAAWILIIAVLAGIGFAVYWFLLAAHISVPDFVGQNVSAVDTWAKQNQMDSGVVALAPKQYSMEYDEGIVMAQSIPAGKKVKKNTPITITVSGGPDPSEAISFPDIRSMTLDELNAWKSENKLLKTKITTQYSDTVANGEVISYELKNVSETDFTRNSTLNIICSKGSAPAEQIAVVDFTGKNYSEVTSWASSKKVTIDKQESFSTKVDAGFVISQSRKASETLKAGETLTVVVSKGKGVSIPSLVGYSKEQLASWTANKNNNVTIVTRSIYNNALEGTVIAQSVKAGTMVEEGDVLELTVSLYLPLLETSSNEWIGQDYLKLKQWVDEANGKGASIQAGEYGEDYQPANSDTVAKGGIIKYACFYGTNDLAEGCGRPLNLNSRITYQRSLGPKAKEETSSVTLNRTDLADLSAITAFCDANASHIACTYVKSDTPLPGYTVSVTFDTTNTVNNGLPEGASKFPFTIPYGKEVTVTYYKQ